jgi:uncharacterized protein YdeI (BOF family)
MKVKIASLATLAAVMVATAAAGPAGAAAPAQVQTAFDGTVVSKNANNRSFRLRDAERGTVRIYVTRNTRFERVNGFAGLRVGARNIESVVRKRNGRWIALEVELSGRVRDDRGGDDSRGRGGDDRGGDDH